jgi:hypothetical protein
MKTLAAQSEKFNLNRGYSEIKREYFTTLSAIILDAFVKQEREYDFKRLIEDERSNERKRVMDEITMRIDSYNHAL